MDKKYEIIRKIGEGQHGAVYLVKKIVQQKLTKWIEQQQQVFAMKKIPLSKHSFDVQAQLLLSLQHPNVVQIKQVIETSQFLILILQLAQQGDLHQYTKRTYPQVVPQNQVISWFCQLCLGLYYLHHQNRIIHRDIKTRNILVKSNALLKLADFGVARKLDKGQDFARTSVGTPYYLSPESINLGRYDHKTDIWSLGCVLYQICKKQKPFQGQSLGILLHNIVNNQFGQLPTYYSKDLRQLITSMLQKDPLKRPTIISLLQSNRLKKGLKQLQQVYPEYNKIIIPQDGPKTRKYLDIEDRKTSCLKIFTQSLKTTKNDKINRFENDNKYLEKETDKKSLQREKANKIYIQKEINDKKYQQREIYDKKYQQKEINDIKYQSGEINDIKYQQKEIYDKKYLQREIYDKKYQQKEIKDKKYLQREPIYKDLMNQKQKKQQQKITIKNQVSISSKIIINKTIVPIRNPIKSIVEIKSNDYLKNQKTQKMSFGTVSVSLSKVQKHLLLTQNKDRKIERQKYFDKSLKQIIANKKKP